MNLLGTDWSLEIIGIIDLQSGSFFNESLMPAARQKEDFIFIVTAGSIAYPLEQLPLMNDRKIFSSYSKNVKTPCGMPCTLKCWKRPAAGQILFSYMVTDRNNKRHCVELEG